MANPTYTAGTYAGEFSGKILGAALLSASTLDAGAVTIMPNVKYKSVLQVGAWANVVKGASCDFDATTTTLTLTEKVLTTKELQANAQICKKELRDEWQAIEMGFSAHSEIPASFEEYVISRVAAKVADATETSIWAGASGADDYDGFQALAYADSDVVDVTASAVTAANVIDEMGKVVDAASKAALGAADLTLYISTNVARAYIRALGGFGTSGLGAAGIDNKGTSWYSNGNQLTFEGIPVFVANGMGNNKMMLTPKSNLFWGTGLLSDYTEVRFLDMADKDGSSNVRVIMRWTAGCQIGVGADIVYYS
tara:strand:+ start:32 stop:961 length:930 start_codon:yes stop_codon:yes gene_type:complete